MRNHELLSGLLGCVVLAAAGPAGAAGILDIVNNGSIYVAARDDGAVTRSGAGGISFTVVST